MSNTTKLGFKWGWTLGTFFKTENDTNIRKMSALLHAYALSDSESSPPGSPAHGDAYIVPAGASGGWSGRDGQIAVYDSDESAWDYIEPRYGLRIWVEAPNAGDPGYRVYRDSEGWTELEPKKFMVLPHVNITIPSLPFSTPLGNYKAVFGDAEIDTMQGDVTIDTGNTEGFVLENPGVYEIESLIFITNDLAGRISPRYQYFINDVLTGPIAETYLRGTSNIFSGQVVLKHIVQVNETPKTVKIGFGLENDAGNASNYRTPNSYTYIKKLKEI